MLWAALSLMSGLGDSILYSMVKKYKDCNTTVLLFVQNAFALPFLAIFLLFNFPAKINPEIYWTTFLNAALLLLSGYFLRRALQTSQISISLPLLSFTPLFLVGISYVMFREKPDYSGLIGILLIVFGAYIINVKTGSGFFGPLKSLYTVKGSFYVLMVSFVWAITSSLFKAGINYSNPTFYTTFVYFIMTVMMIPFLIPKSKEKFSEIKSNFKPFLLMGIISAVMTTMASVAMTMQNIAYVIALKRSSLVFSILIGYFYFKERGIKRALAGTLIMLLGGVLITLV